MRWIYRSAAAAASAGLVAFLILSPAVAAQELAGATKGGWTLRGFGARLGTTGDTLHSGPPIDPFPPVIESSFTLDDGSGAGLALEYLATRRLGIEALAIRADLDGVLRVRALDQVSPEGTLTRDVSCDLYGVGLNLHLTPGRRADVYLGPLVALARYGDFRADLGGLTFVTDLDDDTAFGVTLGTDVALGRSRNWALTASARRLWATAVRGRSGRDLDLDPLIAAAGVAYRWGGS